MLIDLDDDVRIAELCRAIASAGLVLSNGPDGRLRLHRAPTYDQCWGTTCSRCGGTCTNNYCPVCRILLLQECEEKP